MIESNNIEDGWYVAELRAAELRCGGNRKREVVEVINGGVFTIGFELPLNISNFIFIRKLTIND